MVTFEPLLGRADARGDRTAFNEHLLLGFRLIGLLVIPAAVGYVALPKGLDHRAFEATGELGKALGLGGIIAAFAIGLPGFSSYLFTLQGPCAMEEHRTRSPAERVRERGEHRALAVVLVRVWGVVGLALAFALATVAAVAAVAVVRATPRVRLAALGLRGSACIRPGHGRLVYAVVRRHGAGVRRVLPAIAAGIRVGAISYLFAIEVLRVPGITGELFARVPGLRRFDPADYPAPARDDRPHRTGVPLAHRRTPHASSKELCPPQRNGVPQAHLPCPTYASSRRLGPHSVPR